MSIPGGFKPLLANHHLVISELGGELDLGEIPFETLGYGHANSSPGVVEFTVDRYHSSTALLLPGRREVKILRDDEPVWVGRLWVVRLQNGGGALQCSGLDLLSVLNRRIISDDLDFDDEDQFDIAWSLIDYTQSLTNGDLGITRGSSAPSGIDRSISYAGSDAPKILDSIATLAGGDSGFDFEVDQNRVWQTYFPGRGSETSFVYEWGKNIKAYSFDRDASATVTEQTTTGTLKDTPVTAVEADSDAQLDFGLLQDITSYTDISDADLVTEHCQQDLINAAGELLTPTIVAKGDDPDSGFGRLEPGDTIRVRIDDGPAAQIDRDFRVATIRYDVGTSAEILMRIDCEQEAV